MTFPKWMTIHLANPQQDILTSSWRWIVGGFWFAKPISCDCWTALALWTWGDSWLTDGEHGCLELSLLTWNCCFAGVSLSHTSAIVFVNLKLRVVKIAWLPQWVVQLCILTCVQPVFLHPVVFLAAWGLFQGNMLPFPWALFLVNISQWK